MVDTRNGRIVVYMIYTDILDVLFDWLAFYTTHMIYVNKIALDLDKE